MKRLLTLMVSVALLVAVLPAAGIAQTDDDDEGLLTLHPKLSAGPWFGSGSAGGTTTADVGDMHMVFTADYDATFFFDVTVEGVTTGEWDIQGPVQLNATSSESSFLMIGDLAGTGPISGDAVKLSVDGSTTTNGTATISAGGQTFTQQVSNAAGNPTIDIEVTTTFCNEAYGEWIVSVNQKLEDFSWDPTFSGSWVATKQVDAFAELTNSEQVEIIDGLVELADDWNRWVDPDGDGKTIDTVDLLDDWDTALEFLIRLNDLTNRLRNLSHCDRELIGDDQIEKWLTLLTDRVATIIWAAMSLEFPELFLSGSDLRLLISIGLNTGVIGAGSKHADSAELTADLRLTARHILAGATSFDGQSIRGESCGGGCLEMSNDTINVLVAGSQAGWSLSVAGRHAPASELLTGSVVPFKAVSE